MCPVLESLRNTPKIIQVKGKVRAEPDASSVSKAVPGEGDRPAQQVANVFFQGMEVTGV